MAKIKSKKPIMSSDEERFMAFEGLVQWTQAVVTQSKRVSAAKNRLGSHEVLFDPITRREAIHASHCEDHFFCISAHKLIEYRDWVLNFGLCTNVDFSEINRFDSAIKDLRDMREHIVDYFKGEGHYPSRWVVNGADASSVCGTLIGGRLDWIEFAAAAERLLSELLAQPIPYSHD